MRTIPKRFLWPLLLAGLTAIFFLPVLRGEFLHWDDRALYVENPYYTGLSSAHWTWMCTTFRYGHWQPLTWLSCALDYKVWMLNASGWHLTNLLMHAVNAVLVYWLCLAFLRQRQSEKKTHPALTGTPPAEGIPEAQVISPIEINPLHGRGGRNGLSAKALAKAEVTDGVGYYVASALAALFWAVHPLRVEAVAWLSTRGYLLCTAFCLLTVLFYLQASEQKRYPLAALLCFTLATFTKGIGMMLPVVLLLMDWQRAKSMGQRPDNQQSTTNNWKLLIEKFPFFALSLVTGVTAFLAKRADGGMAPVEVYGPVQRIGQAIYGIWFYLLKTVSPQNLSPLYEKHPELWLVLSALILSTAAGIFLFLFRRKALPIIGTFCAFLLLIFPMLGITQSGSQMFADRFTYLAAIPFSILLASGLSRLKRMRRTVYGALAALLLIFAIQSATYSNVWKSGLSLWSHAVDVDGSRSGAQNNLGIVFLELNDYDRACDCFDKALEIRPEYADALNNRALVRIHNGEYALAVSDLNSALLQNLMSDEDRARMRLSRGMSLENLNETDSAIAEYSFVIDGPNADPVCRLKALQLRAHARLAVGQIGEAKADLSAMLEIPDYSKEFHRKAEMTLSEIKKIPEE